MHLNAEFAVNVYGKYNNLRLMKSTHLIKAAFLSIKHAHIHVQGIEFKSTRQTGRSIIQA